MATSLDDVAAEAGVTRVILYRHFESKADMYRSVLERACSRLANQVGGDDFDANAIPALVQAAGQDPDAFRLLFHRAIREPEFQELVDNLTIASTEIAHRNLATQIPGGAWLDWAARLIPAMTVDAVIAWLDAGRPDPDQAAARIGQVVAGVIHAAQGAGRP